MMTHNIATTMNPETQFDIEHEQYIETPWSIIESYFKGQHLERFVRHQLESYNNFVGYQIIKTIEMFNPVHIASEQDFDPVSKKHSLELIITFENFHIYRPQIHENNGAIKLMFPQEARLRNFTYASATTIDINIKYIVRNGANLENIQTFYKTIPKVHIGKLPIMLKSNICVLNQYKHFENTQTGECKFDAGGYFIINGSEKTVLGQERAAENRVYCFNIAKNDTKYTWKAEVKSVPDYKCISPKQINMMVRSKNSISKTDDSKGGEIKTKGISNAICVELPRVKQPIPLFIVFRALGIITDKEICERILLKIDGLQGKAKDILEALQPSIIESNKYMTQEECIRYITSFVMYTPINMDKETGAKKKHEFTLEILNNDLFPHCHTMEQKIYFLGYMANRLLMSSFDQAKQDDRDSYLNKRVDCVGTLLNNLYRNYFNKLVKDMEKQIIREINTGSWKSSDDYESIINMTNIYKIIKSTTIENGIKRALSTGDFGIKHTNSNKVGVAQVLNRLNYVSSLSHARRISTPTDKSGKLIPPRKLHNTTFGFLCLTGDTDVLLSNRVDTKKIKDIKDGNWVNTINRETLLDEPSDMYNSFCKMPDKLFEIVTISGRKIKATSDHPFLVKCNDGKYIMKNVSELSLNDKVIIRHTIQPIADENITCVIINDNDVLEHYRMDLLELNLLNTKLPIYKLKIIARLIGALNTDGHLGIRKDDIKYYSASFNVGEEYDVYQLVDDIKAIGFDKPSIQRKITKFEDKINNRTTMTTTWEVAKSGIFAYFMCLMGGFVGKKTNIKRNLPDWLINAELSIKREFLSAFQGGDGSRLSYQKNGDTFKPNLGITIQTTHNNYLNDTIEYMTQVVNMFKEFNISCRLNTNPVDDLKTRVCIVFEKSTDNLIRYADIINYTYCEEKRRASAPIIEHLKIRGFNKIQRDNSYQYVIDNYDSEKIETLIEKTNLSENQIKKVISKNKKGLNQNTRFTTDIIYKNFIKENIVNNGCISIPILSISEIEPELVYDFTTRSDNHSFVASSFVVSNCPAETPEGQSVGIVKNLSYMTHITTYSNSLPLYEYIMPHVQQINKELDMYGKAKVFINGAWVGITDEPDVLYRELKDKKQKGIINIYTSIIFDYKMCEIRVCNDSGRLSRPLLRVKDKNIQINNEMISKLGNNEFVWDDLLTSSKLEYAVIEYIDPEEQSWSLIATNPKDIINPENKLSKYTHCEIHPSTMFGVLASCIPFPEHNQSPRNCYQCAQGKQAMGVYVTNYENRMDKTAYVLNYPMRPLVDTRIMNLIQLNKIPSGTQVVVAIMTHTGYNQEDSLLINKGSIDRGMALVTVYHTEKDEDKQKINGDEEIRCKPDVSKTKGMKIANYNKVNSKGVIPENTLVENRDIIIAKVTPIKENRNDHTKVIKFEDQSKIYKTTEETYIDKNYIDRNGEGYNFAKVRLRTTRKPVIGDKFSSRHGQKGTIGNIIPECDMPFTSNGVKPDIIINPHAIPSRMTIGQLKETILGKVLLELGLFGDGTSFGNFDVKDICEQLIKVGYEAHGNELLYNGLTGEQHECSVFMGPVFYQRLKHMVNDKAHSRSNGPMVNLTRQPAEGRSRDGGLRFGEMEKDAMVSHGAARFTRGRMYDASDKYSVFVCKKCGIIASYNEKMHIHHCRTCDNRVDFAYVEIPYACKLLFQELNTMNIMPRLITDVHL
jgi:DNA-directed RNA polymerase beta subunit/intein/homing endonuclease